MAADRSFFFLFVDAGAAVPWRNLERRPLAGVLLLTVTRLGAGEVPLLLGQQGKDATPQPPAGSRVVGEQPFSRR